MGFGRSLTASHDLAGADHNADTLADLNTKISDATLIDTTDARLSDARTPTAHSLDGASHTVGALPANQVLTNIGGALVASGGQRIDATTIRGTNKVEVANDRLSLLEDTEYAGLAAGGLMYSGSGNTGPMKIINTAATLDASNKAIAMGAFYNAGTPLLDLLDVGMATDFGTPVWTSVFSIKATGEVYDQNDRDIREQGYISTPPDIVGPTGTPPEAVYAFDAAVAGLLDLTANNHDLAVFQGAVKMNAVDGLAAFDFDGALGLRPPAAAGLRMDGALTIEAVVTPMSIAGTDLLCVCGDGLATDEIPYWLGLVAGKWQYIHQSAGPVARLFTSNVRAAVGMKQYICFTRDAATLDVNIYINGQLAENGTMPFACMTPTGASRLAIGCSAGGVSFLDAIVPFFRITAAEYTPAQVAEAYSQVQSVY